MNRGIEIVLLDYKAKPFFTVSVTNGSETSVRSYDTLDETLDRVKSALVHQLRETLVTNADKRLSEGSKT